MKITTAAEMREIDRVTTDKYGVPSLTLMENAGTGVADFILGRYPEAQRITVVCGKGNNGGDGFVIARALHDAGRVVEVILLARPDELKGDNADMFHKLPVRAASVETSQQLTAEFSRAVASCDLLVDAILGTGFKPPLKGLYAEAIAAINHSGRPVVAVDIPSGAESDLVQPQSGEAIARADAIVTFTAPRPVHVFGALTRGPVLVVPIGSPGEAIVSSLNLEVTTPRDFSRLLAPRPLDSNKGMYGHALIVGGSLGKSGAAAMAGMAALRAGAGLSTVAVPRSVLPSVASFAAELMTEPLAETSAGGINTSALDRVVELASTMTVVALGPGIGRQPETFAFVHELVKRVKCPLVIDADGLNAFQGKTELLDGRDRPLVLTPHPGEMSRLTGLSIKGHSGGPAERCAHVRRAASSRPGAEGKQHDCRAARWAGLGESHRQSWHGDWRYRRHPYRNDSRRDRPDARRRGASRSCRRLPARSGRRCGGRDDGRALAHGDRPADRIARSLSPGYQVGE